MTISNDERAVCVCHRSFFPPPPILSSLLRDEKREHSKTSVHNKAHTGKAFEKSRWNFFNKCRHFRNAENFLSLPSLFLSFSDENVFFFFYIVHTRNRGGDSLPRLFSFSFYFERLLTAIDNSTTSIATATTTVVLDDSTGYSADRFASPARRNNFLTMGIAGILEIFSAGIRAYGRVRLFAADMLPRRGTYVAR